MENLRFAVIASSWQVTVINFSLEVGNFRSEFKRFLLIKFLFFETRFLLRGIAKWNDNSFIPSSACLTISTHAKQINNSGKLIIH